MTMDMMQREYTILDDNTPTLAKLVARLNRKAAKHGMLPIVMRMGDTSLIEDENGIDVYVMRHVTITGETPRLKGWTFVATIQHAGEAGNILRTMPGWDDAAIPTEYRTAAPECDHCQTYRRRNDTFLVYKPSTFAQVGRNCLADFIGTDRIETAMSAAECWSLIEEGCNDWADFDMGRGGGESRYAKGMLLAFAAQSVISEGWVSRSKAADLGKIATADATLDNIKRARKDERYLPTDAALTLADRVLEWAPDWLERELSRPNSSDYVWNMKVVLEGEYVTHRGVGLAVSVIGAYQREMERAAKIERERQNTTSVHVGTVGKRQTFDLTVKSLRYIDGSFGTTTLVTYNDQDGNVVKWFASGYQDVKEGDTVRLMATVKAHGEWNGVLETTITRAKVVK